VPLPVPQNEYLVDFPTLWVAIDWVEHHCVIPDGFAKGQPYELADWQTWFYVNHYRIKPTASLDGRPAVGAPAFHYRRSQIVMPQKALALDTPIATPNGWSTMERLIVGDLVFDKDGQPTKVLSKSHRWLTDTFRVEFSDGSSLIACGDHEWVIVGLPSRVSTMGLMPGMSVPAVPAFHKPERRITAITPIEPVLTQCLTVESTTHTFLAGSEMIPTGNSGKGPLTASQCCLEGVGPALFAGWAVEGDVYRCRDHGCPCGWEYWYGAGEPMGVPWPTPLIQITAFSEEQPLALDTPVPTPTGWSSVGALKIGDEVFDQDGIRQTVQRATRVINGLECFEVTFSDGEKIVASAGHGWTMERKTSHGDRHEVVTVTTEELAETYLNARYRTGAGAEWELPRADLALDPYLLGLWLGDGSTADSTIAYDSRLRGEMESIVKPLLAEHEEIVWTQSGGNEGTFRIRRRYGHDLLDKSCGACPRGEPRDSMRETLRSIGVLGDKHIPDIYLRASAAQRRGLLQGMIDSDGHVEANGRAGFTNTNPRIIAGLEELLTSLGYAHNKRWDRTANAWRLFFVPTSEAPVARLAHKVVRRRGSAWRYVSEVRPVESVPVRCIGIDTEEHLFLVGRRAVPTHNTDNVYGALKPMIENGPLANIVPRVGEEFMRLPGGGRIDTVTSNNQSRLGQRVTFVPQDEAMHLDTPLPTPTGWTTMGEVEVGDLLIGADGRPVRVIKTTEVQHGRICYRVTFKDGTSVVASDGHQWLTRVAASVAKPQVRTTGDMFSNPLTPNSRQPRRFCVPAPEPYDLPEVDLPVSPYLLGLWLGDGRTGNMEIAAHNDEAEELCQYLIEDGASEARVWRRQPKVPIIKLSRKMGFQGDLRPDYVKRFQALPAYRLKHIPEEYFRASLEQRLMLLRGLMDSDGHCTATGFCTFAGNEQLTGDMVRLLRTVGISVQNVKRADPRARTGFGWKVNFTPRNGMQPFRLKRKADRVKSAWAGSDWIVISSIEPVESVPVRCVGVDSDDHLFLAGEGGHVTHNCGLWLPMSKDGKGGNMVKVAHTQRRGASGMSGRVTESTNAWDPSENSVAQQTALSALTKKDIFRLHRLAPSTWSFTDKRERRKILKFVYKGSWWVDLDSIEAEASEILLTDPGQAERFYGNRVVAGLGQWMDDALWEAHEEDRVVPDGTAVAGGFDGSENDDWTAIRLETQDGFRFTPRYGPDRRPAYWNPGEWGGSIPRGEVNACVDEISRRYRLRRFYCDPRDWRSEIGEWALKVGEEEVFEWSTYRIDAMFLALKRTFNDLKSGRTKHDRDPVAAQHISNARKVAKPGDKYILGKPDAHRKIDIAMADTLAHEAAADLHAIGPDAWAPKRRLTRMSGRARSY
jgi:hypothetical protein